MRLGWLKALVLVVVAIMLPVAAGQGQAQEAQEKQTEACPFEKGWKPQDLSRILEEHRKWVERWAEHDYSEDWAKIHTEGRANLCNADLGGANLSKAVLSKANLTEANLTEAFLWGADLTEASLFRVNLAEAILWGANLTEANLNGADLTEAELNGANLTEASLSFANLTNAVYAPASRPPDPYLENIRGLSTVEFPEGSGSGLVQLRELLQKAGLRDLEREATYALESNKTSRLITGERKSLLNVLEGIFRLAAFEWTTGYGLYPGRALLIIVGFGVMLIPVYAWPIHSPSRSLNPVSGIYRVWPSDRIESLEGKPTVDNKTQVERLQGSIPQALGYGAYFSLLSAFHIGWRDLSIGTWITRAQPREYTLKPAGWVRLVSGLQSLLSVYLLAIWALTYFGRPFQ
jgi:Pentapeptide repeats (8 copies)